MNYYVREGDSEVRFTSDLFTRATMAACALCLVLVGATALLIGIKTSMLLDETRTQVHALPALVDGRAAAIQADIDKQITATRTDLNGQLAATRAALVTQVAGTRTDALTAINRLSGTLDSRLASVQKDLNAQLTATLTPAQATLADTDRAVKLLTPQALGLVAASKVAAGQVAQTARTIDKATPALTASIQKAADNAAAASGNSAVLTANLAKATTPLPKWARLGLGVAPPLLQAAYTASLLFMLVH